MRLYNYLHDSERAKRVRQFNPPEGNVRIAPLGHGKKSTNPKNILPSKRLEKFRKGVVFYPFVSFATKRNEAGGLGAERTKHIELCFSAAVFFIFILG